jgi:hypothetical protein
MAKNDMCCGSKVHKPSNRYCCGNETYDRDLQWCRSDKDILELSQDKCGNITYDRKEKMCCEETLNPGTKGFHCCGSESYNRYFNDCRHGNIVKKGFLWCRKYSYIAIYK